jgi:hypothetical protein
MRHLFLVSLLSLAGVLGSCQKDEPEPELPLAGKWPLHGFSFCQFDSLGRLTSQSQEYTVPPQSNFLVVTDSTMQRHNANNMPYTTLRYYTRTGNELTYRGFPTSSIITITTLTATELRILERHREVRGGRQYYIGDEHRYLRL